MPYLVLGPPLAEADHQHPKWFVVRPESVFLPGLNHEFIVNGGTIHLSVNLQMGTCIEEVEQLMSRRMRMQAGAMTWTNMGKVNTAFLVSHNHVDITPWPRGSDRLLALSRIIHTRAG
jgi:hypothetical protein